MGFADIKELSADTTVQEVPIGYPNEPGIFKGLAERSQRAFLCVVFFKVISRFDPPDLFVAETIEPLVLPCYASAVFLQFRAQQHKLPRVCPRSEPDFRRGTDHDYLMAAPQMPVDALNAPGPQNVGQTLQGIGFTPRPESFRSPSGKKMSKDFLFLPVRCLEA